MFKKLIPLALIAVCTPALAAEPMVIQVKRLSLDTALKIGRASCRERV